MTVFTGHLSFSDLLRASLYIILSLRCLHQDVPEHSNEVDMTLAHIKKCILYCVESMFHITLHV